MTDQEQERVTPEQVRDIQRAKIGISKISLDVPARRLTDVLEEIAPQGQKTKLSDWIDQEITIVSVHWFKGKFSDACFVQFTDANGELFNMTVSGKIVLPKLAAVEDQLPVICKVVKKEGGQFGRYWDLE